jgi:hypothetical protein
MPPPGRSKRPPRVNADEAREWLTKSYGGFPCIRGRKHSYPEQHHQYRWVCLARKALDYQRMSVWCFRVGAPRPARNSRFEYLLYHGRPEQIKRRSTRNKHRAHLAVKKGYEVHHRDPKNLSLRSAVIVSRKAHDAIHAAQPAHEKADTKPAARKTKQATKGEKSARPKNLSAARGR